MNFNRGKTMLVPFLFVLSLWTAGCDRGNAEEEMTAKRQRVDFSVRVGLADILSPYTRAGEDGADYSAASSDNEKMNTLRVIVVRPDNSVELNRFIDLRTSPKTEYFLGTLEENRDSVQANEGKWVYLIANEGTTKTVETGGVTRTVKLVDYDFSTVIPGQRFPEEEIFDLKIGLNNKTEQLLGPLPMSEYHRIVVGNEDYKTTLWITRAAVKFTFNITNESGRAIQFDSLKISKMAHQEYFIPRVTARNNHEITGFAVPGELENNGGYYLFELATDELPLTVADGKTESLNPIYLLEGKYTDDTGEGDKNYKIHLAVNDGFEGGFRLSDFLTNLNQLPRNTHVVVNIKVTQPEIEWEVHVHPYISVPLEPDFGL